jgi:hypothetical protein
LSGWEPDKNRNITGYVLPFENTFKLDPLSCMSNKREKVELVIMQHSAARSLEVRMASRNTWKKFEQRLFNNLWLNLGNRFEYFKQL